MQSTRGVRCQLRQCPVMKLQTKIGLLALALGSVAAAERVPVPGVPVTVDLPASARQLNSTQIDAAFPGQGAPQAVFTTDDQKVVMSFEWRGSHLLPSELAQLDSNFAKVIQAKNPKSFTHKLVSINGSPWAQFVFITPGRAGDVRNELLVTSAAGRTLVVNINATVNDYTKNQKITQAITGSLRLQ